MTEITLGEATYWGNGSWMCQDGTKIRGRICMADHGWLVTLHEDSNESPLPKYAKDFPTAQQAADWLDAEMRRLERAHREEA